MLPRESIQTLLRCSWLAYRPGHPPGASPHLKMCITKDHKVDRISALRIPLSFICLQSVSGLLPPTFYTVHLKQLSSPRRTGPSVLCLFYVPSLPRPFPSFSTRPTWLALEHLRRHLLQETSPKPGLCWRFPLSRNPSQWLLYWNPSAFVSHPGWKLLGTRPVLVIAPEPCTVWAQKRFNYTVCWNELEELHIFNIRHTF